MGDRTMLTMEEKGVPYNKMLIDEQKMPEWVKEICDGKQQIPFMTGLALDCPAQSCPTMIVIHIPLCSCRAGDRQVDVRQ